LAASNSAPKAYFDYVSATVLDEICSKNDGDTKDSAALSENINLFFKRFNFTDVILFQKNGKTGQNECGGAYLSLFKTGRADRVDQPDGTGRTDLPSQSVRYYKGTEIEADNENTLHSLIKKARPNTDFLTVRSADEKIIRAAADSADVDAVIPVSNNSQKPAAGQINHIIAKIAADRKTAFAFDIAPFLFVKGYRRSKLFADAAEMIQVLRKYNVPVLLFSGACSVLEQRGPYELEAFGQLLGLTREETTAAVSTLPAHILSERQKQKSGVRLMSGVEILNENDDE